MLHRLEDLTSSGAGEIGSDPGTIGLVVTGATEQHGPHLPLSTDTACASALRVRIPALLANDVLATPVIDVGISGPQLSYAGTLHLDEDVYAAVVRAHLEGLYRTGVRRIALIDFNTPNISGSAEARRAFSEARSTVKIAHQTDMKWIMQSLWRSSDHPEKPRPDHAGRIETSLALALYPDGLVGDFSQIVGFTDFESGDWWSDLTTHGTEYLSALGVLGVPAGANCAEGERIINSLSEDYASWIAAELGVELA